MLLDLLKKGSTNRSITIRIIDSTDGTPETGVVWNTSGIDLWYRRELAAKTSITEATLAALTTTHTDGGFLHIGDGYYRFDIPDAAFATGVEHVDFGGTVTGMVVIAGRIRLVDYDLEDGVRLGLTALPNAAADAAGGLPISDAGGFAVDGIALEATLGTPTDTDIATDLSNLQGATDNIQTRLPAVLVGGKMDSDATAISGDTVAADNLESQYDTTGLTGDTFPATQAQVGSLSVGSAAISVQAESYTLTTGTQSSGTISDAETQNAVYHEHTDTAGALDLYYQFDVTGSGVATQVDVIGRMNGANDSLDGVYAYDWVGAGWDRIGDYTGQSSTTDTDLPFSLLLRHTGTGVNLGKVRIKFSAASGLTTSTLRIDRISMSYSVVSQTVGYALGRVWLDSTHGTAGTEIYVNGVADKPSDSITDALSIMSSLNIHDMNVSSDSTFAPTADLNGFNIYGVGYTATLGGHDYAGTHIFHASPVNGIATTAGASDHFDLLQSIIDTMTSDDTHFTYCVFIGTYTFGTSGIVTCDVNINDSKSGIAGSGAPVFTKTAGATLKLNVRGWKGGFTLNGLEAGDVVTIGGTELGTVTLNGADAAVELRGICKQLINNLTGSPTVNTDGCIFGADVADILVDTADMQPKLGTPVVDISTDIAGVQTTADSVETKIDAQDAVLTLPGQVTPSQTPTPREAQAEMYKNAVNKSDQDATTRKFYANDGTTVDSKQTVSDSGTVVTTTKKVAGP